MSTDVVNTAVLRTEIRLFGREPGGVFWILLFPTLLLVILGSVPSFRESDPNLGGLRPVDAYVPVAVLLGLIVGGLQGMPPTITGYRENGILRRMSTTPVRPSALLTAQMLVFGGAALLSALVTLTVGRLAFDVTLPAQPFGYLLALLLALGASLSLGALLSALSRTTKIATAIGSTALFPRCSARACGCRWRPCRTCWRTSSAGPVRRRRAGPERLRDGCLAGLDPPRRAGGLDGAAHGGGIALVPLGVSAAVTHTGAMADVAGVEQRWATVRRWGPYAMLGVGTALTSATMDVIGMGRPSGTPPPCSSGSYCCGSCGGTGGPPAPGPSGHRSRPATTSSARPPPSR